MNEDRLRAAQEGLERLRDDPLAWRAREFLAVAVDHSLQRPNRWTEQMCYALREALESVPPLFGQPRGQEPLGPLVRGYLDDFVAAFDVGRPPEVLRELLSEFDERLRTAEMTRRQRVAQAMITQAGGGLSTPQLDAFAAEWANVVEGVNTILHGGDHTEQEATGWLDRAIELVAVLVAPMSARLDEIDGLADVPSPSPGEVRRLLDLLADPRLARHFFLRVNSPLWLEILESQGVFTPPISGDWYQGDFLARVTAQSPGLARTIATRVASDPHPAAASAVIGVARALGPTATDLVERVLTSPQYQSPFTIAHELERLVEEWRDRETTETLYRLADAALEPQRSGTYSRLTSKFGDHEFIRLVRVFVDKSHCDHVARLVTILVLKLRRAVTLSYGGMGLSWFREDVSSNGESDRDIGNALISGVRDVLRRMRECGEPLAARQAILGADDSEVLVRIWADHLAEEVEGGD